MRAHLVVRRLSHHGGTERFVAGFARHLRDRGARVAVWCDGADLELPGVELRRLGAGGRGRIWKQLSLARAVADLPWGEEGAWVGFVRAPGFPLLRAGGGCHAAWMEVRGWSIADAVEREIDRRSILGAGRVVVNSEMARQDLIRCYGAPPERLQLIRNGVDLERFRPRGAAPGGDPLALFVGSGFTRKGLAAAIRAVARVPGLRLRVIGADPQPERFDALAEQAGLGSRYERLGPQPEPEGHLQQARLLILPTRYDPAANVTLEALASGVPVVTSRRNGAAEILPEPWMALEDPEDDRGLAEAMERILQGSELAERCRSSAERWPASRAYEELGGLMEEQQR